MGSLGLGTVFECGIKGPHHGPFFTEKLPVGRISEAPSSAKDALQTAASRAELFEPGQEHRSEGAAFHQCRHHYPKNTPIIHPAVFTPIIFTYNPSNKRRWRSHLIFVKHQFTKAELEFTPVS